MAQPKAEKRPRGRPSTFNAKDAAEIVSRLSKGEPLTVICRDDWLPTDRTIRNWMDADEQFSSDIAAARVTGFDAIAWRARQTLRGKTEDGGGESTGDVQRDKAIADFDLKLLSKWDPKRYGERLDIDHSSRDGTMSPPTTIQIVGVAAQHDDSTGPASE